MVAAKAALLLFSRYVKISDLSKKGFKLRIEISAKFFIKV